jgi:CHRD domain
MQQSIRGANSTINFNKEIKMKFTYAKILIPVCAAAMMTSAWADNDDNAFKAHLEGYQEVPAISSPGSGKFSAKLMDDGSLHYEISYQDLVGTPFMSHIHLGQKHTNGGIMMWLCGNAPDATPPAGTPACPVPGGTVSGVLTTAQVVGPAGQLIAAGEFAEVLQALKRGAAYVNVHTTSVRSGEIRGQVKD